MSIYNLDKLFNPRTVAVIGVDENREKIGWRLFNNLKTSQYQRELFPVNPDFHVLCDSTCYQTVSDIPKHIDLAVIASPVSEVLTAVNDCVSAGVDSAVIFSAGGMETELKEKRLQLVITETAEKGRLRVIGPNSIGIISNESLLNVGLSQRMPLPGRLAFVSQSGAVCQAILDVSFKEGIGFSYVVSTGSMLDVDFGDLINFLGNDSHVGSIVLFIERLTHVRKFMSAARAVSRVKPVVVLKAGKTTVGEQSVYPHTGVFAGEDPVYNAAFKRAGIVRVDTVEELFDCAELIAKQPIPEGPGLAIITNGAGPGIMTADALADYGLKAVSLAPETMQKLNAALPRIWNRENPIDILKDASAQRWRDVIDICLSAREIHALIMIFVPHPFFDSVKIAETILALLAGRPHRPKFAVWMGGESVDGARRLFNQAAIPTYETPERAVAAFRHMRSYSRNLEMLQEIPPRLDKSLKFDFPEVDKLIKQSVDKSGGWLTDAESRKLLEAYGIPVNPALVAYTSEQAVNIAGRIGYPVAIKINSRDIVHKTDARAVALNLDSDRSVQEAFRQITGHVTRCYPHADCQGITVEPMVKRPEIELIMGARKDAAFGPVIVFGAGGVMTDIIRDVGFALPPLNRLLARRLMESTRIYQMLGGYRNRPGANLELLEEILIRLSQLVTDFPQIDLVEINPLILADDRACAVDARVIVKATSVKSSHHLVISPYPDEFEKRIVSKGGLDVFIRPIKPEDASLLIELMQHMSVRSIYYRFCKPVTLLPAKMLALFTQIDYDRDMALVALDSHDGTDKMFGVGRLVRYPDGKKAEFAIMVGDEWHGKGIGSALMRHLMDIARVRGIETLWGLVLAENTQMLALGKKLGFTITPFPDAGQHELEIDLRVAGA